MPSTNWTVIHHAIFPDRETTLEQWASIQASLSEAMSRHWSVKNLHEEVKGFPDRYGSPANHLNPAMRVLRYKMALMRLKGYATNAE